MTKRPLYIAIGFAVIITAIVGLIYYFWGDKNSETVSSSKDDIVLTQSSKNYAIMGRELWSAFACASWASVTGDVEEQERLFLFGYKQGQEFLSALKAEKIAQEDILRQVPIGVTLVLQGPTEEFILGRIFEAAQEEALDEVFKTGNEFNSNEVQKSIAENKFRDGNCQLIEN